MPITIEHSLVRIYNSEGDPAGVGFAIAPKKLLTCVHLLHNLKKVLGGIK